MGKEGELWDDSALLNAFDDAMSKYKKMHARKTQLDSALREEDEKNNETSVNAGTELEETKNVESVKEHDGEDWINEKPYLDTSNVLNLQEENGVLTSQSAEEENNGSEFKDGNKKLPKGKRNFSAMDDSDCAVVAMERFYNRMMLCLTKPSYGLMLGTHNLRAENRAMLCSLLRKLVRHRNWVDASGVLSVLLKGTRKNRSPALNRFKYLVSMELVDRIENSDSNLTAIESVYDTLMTRIGVNLSNKRRRIGALKEEGFIVRLESILVNLMRGNVERERQNARSLVQEHEFDRDPMFNLILGLIFYQLWYFGLPEEMQLTNYKQVSTPTHSDMDAFPQQSIMSDTRLSYEKELDGHNSVFSERSNTYFECESETSVMKDKRIDVADNHFDQEVATVDINNNLPRDNDQHDFETQGFYAYSAENEVSLGNENGHTLLFPNLSVLKSLDSWLLPIQTEHWEPARVIQDEDYKNSVKYLRQAVYSTPPVLEGLLPLTQLLLIGCQDREALNIIEKFCDDSIMALPARMKANMLQHIDQNGGVVFSTCLEDALKSDPSSSESLSALVRLHRKGDYDASSLIEMIALHLDAVFADHDTWREFALCFYAISLGEEDRMSVLQHGSEDVPKQKKTFSVRYNRVPKSFTTGKSRKAWKLRCKWWSGRHFSLRMLASEIASDDLQLITYKAACASHIYGQYSEYVLKAFTFLQNENNRDLFSFLQQHVQRSIGIDLNIQQTSHQ